MKETSIIITSDLTSEFDSQCVSWLSLSECTCFKGARVLVSRLPLAASVIRLSGRFGICSWMDGEGLVWDLGPRV